MLCSEIIAVCSDIHRKTYKFSVCVCVCVCGQNVGFFNVVLSGV
jgi:hypothetical protein